METVQVYTIRIYTTREGRAPFLEWLSSIGDQATVDRIESRLYRVRQGNLGDYRDLQGGLYELRLFFGPGYRIYFARQPNTVILLLTGGAKHGQRRGILQARNFYRDYLERDDG